MSCAGALVAPCLTVSVLSCLLWPFVGFFHVPQLSPTYIQKWQQSAGQIRSPLLSVSHFTWLRHFTRKFHTEWASSPSSSWCFLVCVSDSGSLVPCAWLLSKPGGLSVKAGHSRSLRTRCHWQAVAFCSRFSVCLANWNTSSSKSCFLFPKAFWLVFAWGYSFSLWSWILLGLNNLSLRSVVPTSGGRDPPHPGLISDMLRHRYLHYSSKHNYSYEVARR